MAREINRLSAVAVKRLTEPGRHADGQGLYLSITKGADGERRRWVFLFRWEGKLKELGLGSAAAVSLKEAREAATRARRLVAEGVNPIEAKREAPSTVPTFGAFAAELVEGLVTGFKNAAHRRQWQQTLTDYCAPIAGKRIDAIGTDDVLACLQPIWRSKPETASRLRGRIERVLDAAKAKGSATARTPPGGAAIWNR